MCELHEVFHRPPSTNWCKLWTSKNFKGGWFRWYSYVNYQSETLILELVFIRRRIPSLEELEWYPISDIGLRTIQLFSHFDMRHWLNLADLSELSGTQNPKSEPVHKSKPIFRSRFLSPRWSLSLVALTPLAREKKSSPRMIFIRGNLTDNYTVSFGHILYLKWRFSTEFRDQI